MAPLIEDVGDTVVLHTGPPTVLELTEVESTLRRLLLDAAAYIEANPKPASEDGIHIPVPSDLQNEPVILRFTGGWVRDKLLGVDSHDIDVAINNMTGFQFGLRLKEYLELPGIPKNYGLEGLAKTPQANAQASKTDKSKVVGGLHRIEANPEKSKHLETVTTRILGLDIDLVNLRKEAYSDNSRNPQMQFGTAEEDALRRDATVNAMFYNLNTLQVEDFTGRGHLDMRNKIIRTPLPPFQTFKDDPLRVLRLIRFASRLGYTIEPSAQQAMKDETVKDSLRRKISRERVGAELEKALKGPNPIVAMNLIFNLGLYETVFSDPLATENADFTPDTTGWQCLIESLNDMLKSGTAFSEHVAGSIEERYLAWILTCLIPYRNAPQQQKTTLGKKAPPVLAVQVAREGIKATNRICEAVAAAIANQNDIADVVDRLDQQKRGSGQNLKNDDAGARDVLGMAIRRWGASWRGQLVWAMMAEVAEDSAQLDSIYRKYVLFLHMVIDQDLLQAPSFKPIVDGTSLAKALDIRPGPWMKDALDVVMAYQLRNPSTATAAAAVAEVRALKEKQGELTFALVRHFLKLTIRTHFSKSKPPGVTNEARRTTQEVLPSRAAESSFDESLIKPWKTPTNSYTLDVLRWVVHSTDDNMLQQVWPLLVPPILALIDDWEIKYKALGAGLLHRLLQVTPPTLLGRTGLGEVFQNALMPCLDYLPTVTSQSESLHLLEGVYRALLLLMRRRFPPDSAGANEQVPFLDALVRQGLIHGLSSCQKSPVTLRFLFEQLTIVLDALGIDSVKHTKYIVPLTTEILSYLTSTAYLDSLSNEREAAETPSQVTVVEALLEANKTIQCVIRNCWPRVMYWRNEILKGVICCWLHLPPSPTTDGISRLQEDLKQTVCLLKATVESKCDLDADFRELAAADERLKAFFCV